MDFDRMISYVVSFYHTHTPIAIAIAIAIFFIAYWKPKIAFKFGSAVFFIALVFYMISLLGGLLTAGTKHKEGMINKTEKYLK
jgi:Na+/phosphate symporter